VRDLRELAKNENERAVGQYLNLIALTLIIISPLISSRDRFASLVVTTNNVTISRFDSNPSTDAHSPRDSSPITLARSSI